MPLARSLLGTEFVYFSLSTISLAWANWAFAFYILSLSVFYVPEPKGYSFSFSVYNSLSLSQLGFYILSVISILFAWAKGLFSIIFNSIVFAWAKGLFIIIFQSSMPWPIGPFQNFYDFELFWLWLVLHYLAHYILCKANQNGPPTSVYLILSM